MNEPAASLPLRDIHLPEPVSWWPPAPGWWLAGFAVIVVGLLSWYGIRRWQLKQGRRDSLKALRQIRNQFAQHQDKALLLQELSILMRRASITFYPRNISAGLTGNDWLQFLADTSRPGKTREGFISGDGKWLTTAPYLPDWASPDINSDALLTLCEHWLQAQPGKTVSTARATSATTDETKLQ